MSTQLKLYLLFINTLTDQNAIAVEKFILLEMKTCLARDLKEVNE